jgi:hypothetical protein
MVIVMLIHYFPTLSSFSNDPVFALPMHDFSISSYGIRQALIVLLDKCWRSNNSPRQNMPALPNRDTRLSTSYC